MPNKCQPEWVASYSRKMHAVSKYEPDGTPYVAVCGFRWDVGHHFTETNRSSPLPRCKRCENKLAAGAVDRSQR